MSNCQGGDPNKNFILETLMEYFVDDSISIRNY